MKEIKTKSKITGLGSEDSKPIGSSIKYIRVKNE
jgi:hypothetical protein